MAAVRQSAPTVPIARVLRQGKLFACGICRKSHNSYEPACACVNNCFAALTASGAVQAIRQWGREAFRCRLCTRTYATVDPAQKCAAECSGRMRSKLPPNPKLLSNGQYAPLAAPGRRTSPAAVARTPVSARPEIRVAPRTLPPPSAKSKAVVINAPAPPPIVVPAGEIPVPNDAPSGRTSTPVTNPDSAPETPVAETVAQETPVAETAAGMPMAEAQAHESAAPESNIDRSTTTPPSDPGQTSIGARKKLRDKSEKFRRDGARYVCKECGGKYFTRNEVEACFDKHPD